MKIEYSTSSQTFIALETSTVCLGARGSTVSEKAYVVVGRGGKKKSIPVTKLGCPGMTASEEETFKLIPEW